MQFGTSSETNIYTHICVHVPNALSRMRFIRVLHVVQTRRTECRCEVLWLSSQRRSQAQLARGAYSRLFGKQESKGSSHCVQKGPEL